MMSIARVEVVFTPDDPSEESFAIEVLIDPKRCGHRPG